MTEPATIHVHCPWCNAPVAVSYDARRDSVQCPQCQNHMYLDWLQAFRLGRKERRRRREERYAQEAAKLSLEYKVATKGQTLRAQKEASARRAQLELARQRDLEQQERQLYYQAVVEGRAYDVEILVEELKNDWVALQELGLTQAHIRQGLKSASPAVGAGSYLLGAPPWLSVILAVGTYFASQPVGEEYVQTQFLRLHAKWARILANCDATQISLLSETLQKQYPLVYVAMSSTSGLPPS